MSLIVLSLLVVLTGVLLYWAHCVTVNASNGNESGYISFFLIGSWSMLQMLFGGIGAVVWLITRTDNATVWWTFAVLDGLAFIGPAILFWMQIHYFFTEGGYPDSWSSSYLRCKNCGHLNNLMHSGCAKCGHDELQAVWARNTFDWRKPGTWFKHWEITVQANAHGSEDVTQAAQ